MTLELYDGTKYCGVTELEPKHAGVEWRRSTAFSFLCVLLLGVLGFAFWVWLLFGWMCQEEPRKGGYQKGGRKSFRGQPRQRLTFLAAANLVSRGQLS